MTFELQRSWHGSSARLVTVTCVPAVTLASSSHCSCITSSLPVLAPSPMLSSAVVAFLASQLSGAFCVFVTHLHLRVDELGILTAAALPEDTSTSADSSESVSADVIIDIVSSIRAALFFAAQELKVCVCVCWRCTVTVTVCARYWDCSFK